MCRCIRKAYGELSRDLEKGDRQAERVAKIVHLVSPISVSNEVDYDDGVSAKLLLQKYLSAKGEGRNPLQYVFAGAVNTGVPSHLDLDRNGRLGGPMMLMDMGSIRANTDSPYSVAFRSIQPPSNRSKNFFGARCRTPYVPSTATDRPTGRMSFGNKYD